MPQLNVNTYIDQLIICVIVFSWMYCAIAYLTLPSVLKSISFRKFKFNSLLKKLNFLKNSLNLIDSLINNIANSFFSIMKKNNNNKILKNLILKNKPSTKLNFMPKFYTKISFKLLFSGRLNFFKVLNSLLLKNNFFLSLLSLSFNNIFYFNNKK